MLRRLAQAGIDFMTKHPTKQAGDFNPDSVNAIRAHLRKSGLSAKEASYALIARLALRSWIDALDAGEKIDVRQIHADIETRYASRASPRSSSASPPGNSRIYRTRSSNT